VSGWRQYHEVFSRVMARERIYLFDTTLRDGAQTHGLDFTLADKLAIARLLDDCGIDYIEAGYPGANPVDTQLFGDGLRVLTDYRVRILNGGTEAVTRVLIESEDERGERWSTLGVSANIIDASFQALMDSIIFKLVRSGAPA
jgi:2-isopropylmalate synthase